MSKRLISLITLIAILSLTFGVAPGAFANTGVNVTVVYDLANKEYTSGGSSTFISPIIINDDDTTTVINAFAIRNRGGNVSTDVIDGNTVIKYSGVGADVADTNSDTYINLYANNEKTEITSGRLVYTGRFYTNTTETHAKFKINNSFSFTLWTPGTLKADTWYNFKYVVDLERDKNNVICTFTEDGAVAPTVRRVTTYSGDSFSSTRADIDIEKGKTEWFTAYDDLKLTYTTGLIDISLSANGNKTDATYENGIFSAESAGSGLFAIGLYDDLGELVNLKVVENKDELESVKLNMVLENTDGCILKVFRFEADGTPFMINKELTLDNTKNIRIYVNEDFSGLVPTYSSVNGTTLKLTDGRLELTGNATADGVSQNPRWSFPAYNCGRYVIFEGEYQLGTAELNKPSSQWYARLLANNYTSTLGGNNINTILDLTNGTNIRNRKNNDKIIGTLSSDKPTKISLKMDLLNDSFDVYIDGVYADSANSLFARSDMQEGRNIGFFVGHSSSDGENAINMLVDNIRMYEGTEFKDINGLIPNVHLTDFSSDKANTTVYDRPSAIEIARETLGRAHPRVMLNSDKVSQIKHSTDENVIKWRTELLERAENALSESTYNYSISSTGTMQDFPEGISRVMDLGLAYLLTKDTRYSDRAYIEAEVLMNYKRTYTTADGGTAQFDDWNSCSYLDVGEGSLFMAICYDWMYDAWTPEQKKAITDATVDKSIDLSYKILHGQNLESDLNKADSYKTGRGWYDNTNNWGSVCNGGVYTACIAFMEADPFKCATVAESTTRNIEYLLSSYAPDGAWAEGPTYWGYTLKYLSAMLSTMEASCGTVYGLDKAEGLSNTALYSLSLEGKAGVANFGDCGSDHVKAPTMFYLSSLFNNPTYTAATLYEMDKFGFEANAFDLIYYDPSMNKVDYEVPTAYRFLGTETVSFSSGYGENDNFIVISGGKGKATSHDHLDSGGVIVDMKGRRLFSDIGAEHYNAPGYFGANRYKYFRARPESHNIFIINPDKDPENYYGQNIDAVSQINFYDPANHIATMDLTAAYERDVISADRTIALEGEKVVITDSMELITDDNDIYWNWYVNTRQKVNSVYSAIGSIDISADGKSATIILNGTTYNVSFVTDCEYTLAVEEASYYGGLTSPGSPTHSNQGYQRLVLKMENCNKKDITIKTIIQ